MKIVSFTPLPLLLACCAGLVALLAPGFAASASNAVLAEPINASYPAACGGGPVQTGLCLLGSTSPLAAGRFYAARLRGGTAQDPAVYPVTLNVSAALPAGSYELYRDSDMDSLHRVPFTVTDGNVLTVKTATIQWSAKASSNLSIDLSASPGTVDSQGISALSWSATGATSCKATTSYGWSGSVPLSGSLAVTLTDSTTYTLACVGKDGVSLTKTLTVNVDPNVTACLFNWAERNYPSLFPTSDNTLTHSDAYTYRYYADTQTYLGVAKADNNVYLQGPDGVLQNEGPQSSWLPTSGCAKATLPTLSHVTGSNPIRLQHFIDKNGINGRGCETEFGNEGAQAYLPGVYHVSTATHRQAKQKTPSCANGDSVSFVVAAGEAVALHQGSVLPQTLSAVQSYRHPTKAISLTNIDHLRHDISRVGYLKGFQSIRGIHNPSSAPVDALVLSGAPNFDFVVPVQVNPGNPTYCGLTLERGGIPPRNLMTNCVFDNTGKLTQFQVNPGQYYSFDNIHAKSAASGHVINSPFIVSGVQFNVQGN